MAVVPITVPMKPTQSPGSRRITSIMPLEVV